MLQSHIELQWIARKIRDQYAQALAGAGIEDQRQHHEIVADVFELPLSDQTDQVRIVNRGFDFLQHPTLVFELVAHVVGAQGVEQRVRAAQGQCLRQLPADLKQAHDAGRFRQRFFDEIRPSSCVQVLLLEQILQPKVCAGESSLGCIGLTEARVLIPTAGHQYVGEENEFAEACGEHRWVAHLQPIQMRLQRNCWLTGILWTGQKQWRRIVADNLSPHQRGFQCAALGAADRRYFLVVVLEMRICFARRIGLSRAARHSRGRRVCRRGQLLKKTMADIVVVA